MVKQFLLIMRIIKNKINIDGIKNGYHEEYPTINDMPYIKSNVKSCGYYINNKKEGVWTFYFVLSNNIKGTLEVYYKDNKKIGSRKVSINNDVIISFGEEELFEGERLDIEYEKKSFLKKLISKLLVNIRSFL